MAMMKDAGRLLTAEAGGRPDTVLPSASGQTWNYLLQDLWGFMRVRKKYWLLPLTITLVFFGTVIVLSSGSAIAPFIYTLF